MQEELTSYKAETVDGKVKRVKTTRVVEDGPLEHKSLTYISELDKAPSERTAKFRGFFYKYIHIHDM